MSSGLLDLRRNIGIRLSLWYALIFTLSGVGLLTLAYYLLAAAISSKDQEVLEARLKEVATVYDAGGLNGVRNWVRNQPQEVQQTLLVRLVNVFNNVVFVSAPVDWLTVPTSQQAGKVINGKLASCAFHKAPNEISRLPPPSFRTAISSKLAGRPIAGRHCLTPSARPSIWPAVPRCCWVF